MPSGCYFESHINVVSSDDRQSLLKNICEDYSAHLSRNVFKMYDNGTYTIMVTHRVYEGTYEEFKAQLENLKKELAANNFNYEKITTEFSIYDTKLSHDTRWLTLK